MCAAVSVNAVEPAFKRCPMCRCAWKSAADLLGDSTIRFIGRQSGRGADRLGLMMFNHACGTTFAVEAEKFL